MDGLSIAELTVFITKELLKISIIVMNWIEPVNERGHWTAYVNVAMNFLVNTS